VLLTHLSLLTSLALLAFASNLILYRLALSETSIDAASFTLVSLISAALILWSLLSLKDFSGKHCRHQ